MSKKKKEDTEPPLAMKFYDTDVEIIKKLKLNFYIKGRVMRPKLLYQQSDGSYLYRINYYSDNTIHESVVIAVTVVDDKFTFTKH